MTMTNPTETTGGSAAPAGPHPGIQPYLFFDGRTEEAIAFYQRTLGAEVVMLLRFGESPDANSRPPGVSPDQVMHATLRVGESTLHCSDGRCEGSQKFEGFALTLNVPDVAAAERLFAQLGKGGEVQMPMTATFFSPRFGMLADRFGVSWMVMVPPAG